MKTIWVVQYNDGTADVFNSEQGAPALPYIDAFEVQNRIAELKKRIVQLEGALEDIATYATIETPEVVMEIISGMLNKEER